MADAFDNLLRDSLHQMSYEVTKIQNIAHLPTRQVKDLRNLPTSARADREFFVNVAIDAVPAFL